MEAIILNRDLEPVGIIDVYKSFIWTDRYDECGDFEISLLAKDGVPDFIQKEYYVITKNSDRAMIIESIEINSDIEQGVEFLVNGRSLESLLDRRIVWSRTSFEAEGNGGEKPNLQNGIELLLNENVINPAISTRKIDNFVFKPSVDEKVTSLTFEAQYFGEDLYSIFTKLCQENGLGFKVTLDLENKQFVFELYAGADRSYGTEDNPQTENHYVVFSPRFDNIFNTSYLDSISSLKNVTLVGGESETNDIGEEISRDTYVVALAGLHVGLDRREIFTDANGVKRNVGGEDALTEEQYQAHLQQAGIDTLIENTAITAFDGEVDFTKMYFYGEDYFIGDIVQIENEYGQNGQAYVSEFVMSCDEQGTSAYPTFKTIERGVYETE